MNRPRRWRLIALGVVLAALAGCATNRILQCEAHLVPINVPPPPAAPPTRARNAGAPPRTGHRP